MRCTVAQACGETILLIRVARGIVKSVYRILQSRETVRLLGDREGGLLDLRIQATDPTTRDTGLLGIGLSAIFRPVHGLLFEFPITCPSSTHFQGLPSIATLAGRNSTSARSFVVNYSYVAMPHPPDRPRPRSSSGRSHCCPIVIDGRRSSRVTCLSMPKLCCAVRAAV